MPRSIWKPFHVCPKLLNEIYLLTKAGGPAIQKRPVRTRSRSSIILPQFLGYRFQIHNGYKYVNVEVKNEMVGRKFWEFAPTRKRPIHPKGIAESKSKKK